MKLTKLSSRCNRTATFPMSVAPFSNETCLVLDITQICYHPGKVSDNLN